ncbi:MAG: phosphoribosylanthranilate isomerase, partial [Alphaproteobacteria bacterium]|nr:phosphoribosylanthranilate isomerase [Alphaproteobacteria bacterium]
MHLRIKICGINSIDAATAAVSCRADFGGLVFFPPSPRHTGFDRAARLAEILRGKVQIVSLLVNPDDSLIAELVARIRPDVIQLHGDESPARVAAVANLSRKPVMKALAVAAPEDVRRAQDYHEVADYILFDSRPGPAAERPGGVGLAFDWRILSGIRLDRPWGIAGGLNPENVGRAIAIANPAFVDASSGVEDAPGQKNREKIAAFVSAARGAATAP